MKYKLFILIAFTVFFFSSCKKDSKSSADEGCYSEQRNSSLNNGINNGSTDPNTNPTIYYYECFYGTYSGTVTNNNISIPQTITMEEGTKANVLMKYGNTSINCMVASNFNDITISSGSYYTDNTYYDIKEGKGTRTGSQITLNFTYAGALTPFNSMDVKLEATKID